jgi:GMP synthase - Glutamine amidotransferase domain
VNIIVLQHIKIEDPGYIKDLMLADGFNLTTIELDEGEKIPTDLSNFDAMFCMGGPMDTWMEKEYPWLIDEKKAIKKFVIDLKKPYLGFCLGCQLLGEIIGGKVVKSINPEIGMLNINFSENKNSDPLFLKFPKNITSLQWHSYEVQGLEDNNAVTLLASSSETKYQIFRYQNHAYGIQFHIEVKDTTVNEWGCVPQYKSALEKQLGPGALEKFDNEAQANMKNMNNYSNILYSKFKSDILKKQKE